ncbi:MAG: hypothetical protein K9J06_04860 [Flavobacteriales bacterium]|nr:hypothetical protein [Flavobacteriales bacterium]
MSVTRSEIQQIRALQQRPERKATGLFLVEGVKVVSELIASRITVEALYCTDPAFLDSMQGDFRRETVTSKDLERMSSLTTPNAVIAVARIPAVEKIAWHDDLILALDGLRDPGNLGTIIRTARWFGVQQILCSADCVDAFGPKVVQGAMGALFHTSIIPCELRSMVGSAKQEGFRAVSATLEGIPVHGADLSGRIMLVIGSESHGVSSSVREVCDMEVSIPFHGLSQPVESLNAAIAAGILISELRQHAGHVEQG